MKRFLASAFLLGAAAMILTTVSSDKPKAEASPTIESSLSIENAALKKQVENFKSEVADLTKQLTESRAAQAVQPDAPVVETPPAAGVPTSPAAFVAYPRVPLARSQSCANGACMQPAAAPKQYQYQSRSSQPRRLFGGRLFGRR
jgi:hypothetical protein